MPERTSAIARQLVNWQVPTEFEGIVSYNPRHDIQDFLDLASLQGKISPAEFAQRQIQTINRTKRQLEKTLGERFRVRSSQIEYFCQDNILKSPDYPGSVVRQYEKGQTFLAQNGSTETERESAEVEGLRQIEKTFAQGKLDNNVKVIIISPQGPDGSLYTDNFFDVWEKTNGKITMTRYHSTHNYQGFYKAVKAAAPSFDSQPQDQLDAAFFLQRPIITNLPTDQILETFALDHNTQLESINQQIIEACMPYILYYIRVLTEKPLDFEEIKKSLNTIYNVADQAEKSHQNEQEAEVDLPIIANSFGQTSQIAIFATVREAVDFYGHQPVRSVSFGCPGGQKGFSVAQSPFLRSLATAIGAESVVDFANISAGSEKTLSCQCPFCHQKVDAIISNGRITCPNCEKSAPYQC